MLTFMDYIQHAFSSASHWNLDNSYSSLTTTADALLDFRTPSTLRLTLSSLSTTQFSTSYTLSTLGLLDGSLSYLFSTISLSIPSASSRIPLRTLVRGYRQLSPPNSPLNYADWKPLDIHQDAPKKSPNKPATLLHATLHLPPPTTLQALFLRRINPTTQLSLSLASSQGPGVPSASLLAQLQQDTGKWSTEYLFSTDSALFGFRGLWNFGPDPRHQDRQDRKIAASLLGPPQSEEEEKYDYSASAWRAMGDENSPIAPPAQPPSLLSAGGEVYYSPLSSVIGLSTGLRFCTLPTSTPFSSSTSSATSGNPSPTSSFPYTLTLTLTPLTGSLSTSYSVLASKNLALSSRFGFNVYSWESEMVCGAEIWRPNQRRRLGPGPDGLEWARRKMRQPLAPDVHERSHEDGIGIGEEESVLKVRVDQSWNVRVLWEGRVKELLVSAGVNLGPGVSGGGGGGGGSLGSGIGGMGWRGVGVEIGYSS